MAKNKSDPHKPSTPETPAELFERVRRLLDQNNGEELAAASFRARLHNLVDAGRVASGAAWIREALADQSIPAGFRDELRQQCLALRSSEAERVARVEAMFPPVSEGWTPPPLGPLPPETCPIVAPAAAASETARETPAELRELVADLITGKVDRGIMDGAPASVPAAWAAAQRTEPPQDERSRAGEGNGLALVRNAA